MTPHASPASQSHPHPSMHPPLPPPRSTGAQQSETELKARKSFPLSTIASVKQCAGQAEREQAEQREQSGQRELSAWEQKTWCKQSPTPHCMELVLCRYGAVPSPSPPPWHHYLHCARTAPAQPPAPPAPRSHDSLSPPLPSLLPRYRPPALRSGRALQLCACNKEDLAMWLSALSSQIDAHQAAADANRRRASARSSSSEADAGTDANAPAADAGVATADRAAAAIGEPIRIKLYKKEAAAKLGARRTGPDPPELLRRTSAPFPLLLPAQRCRPRTPPRRRPTAHRRPHRHPNRRPHPWRRH